MGKGALTFKMHVGCLDREHQLGYNLKKKNSFFTSANKNSF